MKSSEVSSVPLKDGEVAEQASFTKHQRQIVLFSLRVVISNAQIASAV